MGQGRGRRAGLEAFEEIGDVDAAFARQLIEPARADAIGRGLVFLHLLVGDAERLAELFLGQAQFRPTLADALPDMAADALDVVSRCSCGPGRMRPVSRVFGCD
jgi:hypothetical protein